MLQGWNCFVYVVRNICGRCNLLTKWLNGPCQLQPFALLQYQKLQHQRPIPAALCRLEQALNMWWFNFSVEMLKLEKMCIRSLGVQILFSSGNSPPRSLSCKSHHCFKQKFSIGRCVNTYTICHLLWFCMKLVRHVGWVSIQRLLF